LKAESRPEAARQQLGTPQTTPLRRRCGRALFVALRLGARSVTRAEAALTRDPWAVREAPLLWRARRRLCDALDRREVLLDGAKATGDDAWLALCPSHDDRRPFDLLPDDAQAAMWSSQRRTLERGRP
jgi:hypothetical protein